MKFIVSTSRTDHLPYYTSAELGPIGISGDSAIARYLVRNAGAEFLTLLGPVGLLGESAVDQWLHYYTSCLAGNGEMVGLSSLINTVLASKTFLVGDELSLADIAILCLLKKSQFAPSVAGNPTPLPHTTRWHTLISHSLERTGVLPALGGGEKKYPPKGAGKTGGKLSKAESKAEGGEAAEGEWWRGR